MFNQSPPDAWQPTPCYCDQAQKGDIDWTGMRTEDGAKAAAEWDRVNSWTNGLAWSSWEEVSTKFPASVARTQYEAQSAIKAIRAGQQTLPAEQRSHKIDDTWSVPRADYVAAVEFGSGVFHAVLFNGEWHQNEDFSYAQTANSPAWVIWVNRFHAILDQVPDDVTVTIVDYHV
jgi:hypothetical protein